MPARRRLSPGTRTTAASALVGIALQGCVAVSGIFAARLLGPTDRGNFALLWLVPLALAFIGGAGVPTAATYYVAKDRGTARAIVRRLAPVAVGQVAGLMGLHALILFTVVVPDHPSVRSAAWVSLAALPALLFAQYPITVLQGLRRFGLFNAMRLLPAALYAATLLVLFLTGGANLTGVMVAWSATWGFGALAALVTLARALPPPGPGKAPSRRTLGRFGIRGVLGTVSPVDDLQLDQLLVGFLLSTHDLGLYAAGIAFTNLPRFVAENIGFGAYPRVAAEHDPARARREFWAVVRLAVPLVLVVVAVLQLLVGWLIPALLGAAFRPAVTLCRLLLAGSLFFGVRRILSEGARGLGHPGYGALAEAVALGVLVITLPVFLPTLGVDGMAVATGTSSAASVLVLMLMIRRGRDRPGADDLGELAPAELVLSETAPG